MIEATGRSRRRIPRRRFLGGSIGAVAAATLPGGGVFAGGGDSIRIGLVGCGGRGTGAAIQAAAADPGVVITALGDLFPDQLASAAGILAAGLGPRFACPPDRRFVAADAGLHVIAADVDVVILATPPHLRPGHVAAAVRTGRHVFCETPAAVDAAGVQTILGVAAEARRRGLSFVSGLHSRHHAATAATIARVLDGGIGRPLHARATSLVGLPWRRGAEPGWTPAEIAARNWISDDRASGGSLVEHHVHALDRAIWALGDEPPIAAVAVPEARPLPSPPEAAWAPAATVRYHFAAGRVLDAGIDRRAGTRTEIEEWVRGTSGSADLRRHTISGTAGWRHDAATPNAHQACIAALVRALRSSGRVDDLATLCRSTMVAIMGRTAAETGGPVAWHDLWPVAADPPPLRPLQSERV